MSTASILPSLSASNRASGTLHAFPGTQVRQLPAGGRAVPATVSDGVGVPTLHRSVVEFANLDHGATAPALVSVAGAVETVLRTYGSVHRGAGYASRITTGWFEEARATVRDFVGARADDEVIFTRNTTDSFSLFAHILPADAQVFVFESVHHAALLPWAPERTTRLPIPTSAAAAVQSVRDALGAFRATSDAPAALLITGACNVTGDIWPIKEIASVATEFGVRSALDAAQLAPHREVNIKALGVDYVALSGHKMYAPYGAGVLAGREDWFNAAAPYLPAGGASRRVAAEAVEWNTGPARHEGGTPNAVGAIALAAAAAALTQHRDAVEAHEHAIHTVIREGLQEIEGVDVVTLLGEGTEGVGVSTFTVEGYDPTLVARVLADEYGIAVRDGRFCAHLLCDARLGSGSTAVRASVGLGTTLEHAHRLVHAVRTLTKNGPAFEYRHVPGVGYEAVNDPRDLSEPRPW